MSDLTPTDIDRLLELEAKATKAPWKVSGATHVFNPGKDGANVCSASDPWASSTVGYHEIELGGGGLHQAADNAEFIAAARNLVRPLAEQARRVPELEAEIERLRAALEKVASNAENLSWDLNSGALDDAVVKPARAALAGKPRPAEKAEAALAAAREENERLRGLVRGFLDCPEIADCAPEDRDPETDALERQARATLAKEPQA